MDKTLKNTLKKAVSRFSSVSVLVIGDIILDHFIWGTVSRISPEAPVPVVNVTRDRFMLGGSGNVLNNILRLGGAATLCGFVGDDEEGRRLVGLLHGLSPAAARGVMQASDRPTTVKTRVVAQSQQVVRFDREQVGAFTPADLAPLRAFLRAHMGEFDAVVVSDYAKGLVTEELFGEIVAHRGRRERQPLVVDPKPRKPGLYRGATIITPNHHEAEQLAGFPITSEETLRAAGAKIREDYACEALLITRGEAGMALFAGGSGMVTIPTVAREVYDVTGAGDTVVAVLALGLAAGLSFEQAARLANFAAGVVVAKVGTATVAPEELVEVL